VVLGVVAFFFLCLGRGFPGVFRLGVCRRRRGLLCVYNAGPHGFYGRWVFLWSLGGASRCLWRRLGLAGEPSTPGAGDFNHRRSYAIPVAVPDISSVSCGSPPRPLWVASRRCIGALLAFLFSSRVPSVVQRGSAPAALSRWGRAAGLDHMSRASASCYASLGCGGSLFSRRGCCGVVLRVSTSVSWRLAAPPSPRLSRCFLCLRCWWTSAGGLGSLACCGVGVCVEVQRPSLGFLGHLLLRDGRSVVPVFVGLFLAFVAAHGVEADWVFLHHLN
jgi:hypothetical protein